MAKESYSLANLAELESPSTLMMIGVPGSGKSTIATHISELLDVPILSADECRREISGDANDQSVSREAWAMVYDRAQAAIEAGKSVIIDGTHTHAEMRQCDIRRYRQFGAQAVVGIHIQTAIETCITRNNSRDRVVPEYAIRNMQRGIDRYPPPAKDGFDYVIHVEN
ncbi:AAA family ATPase [Candidatus Saccharibacteria bacterium]|nr:AAA family ATPase [Candidatus Saccharibacteria bacterium]